MIEATGKSSVAAVILAAGTSSRMGQTKQLLMLGNDTVLGKVLETVSRSTVAQIIVVLGHDAEAIRATIPHGATVRVNPAYQEGMATSLQEGLRAVKPGLRGALIVLGDQPDVRPETLDQLIETYHRSNARIVIPTYRGFRGNPVLVDSSLFPEVMSLRGDIGCRAIFGHHAHGIVKETVVDRGILLDIDDVADFRRLGGIAHLDKSGHDIATIQKRTTYPEDGIAPAFSQKHELIIVGSDELALVLGKMAKMLGFAVTFVDPVRTPQELSHGDRVLNSLDAFPPLCSDFDLSIIVASRGRFDEEALEQGLRSGCQYIGLVASRKRSDEIMNALLAKGEFNSRLGRVRAPAGIDIGASTPQEIAISILAELICERRHCRKQSVGQRMSDGIAP
jgi:molybdenum cofactor cytidylyltransferase